MRRPKGIKTKKSVAKRFKITAGGKVLRKSAGRRHLMQTKNPKRRRGLRGSSLVHETDKYRITQSLPFSHQRNSFPPSTAQLTHARYYRPSSTQTPAPH